MMIYKMLSKNKPNREDIGNKAYNLAYFAMPNTPKWFVLCANYLKHLPQKNDELLFSDSEIDKINKMLKPHKKYAVRSSANLEDGNQISFAGIFESYLNCCKAEVIKHINACYFSAYSPKALAYYKMNNIDPASVKMAVLIQEMVDASYAGVINTINPITNNPDEIVICCTKGLGEKLVSGEVNSSDYYINGSKIRCETEDILPPKILNKIIDMTKKAALKVHYFLDIEFAVKKNSVYFLQARPIVGYSSISNNKKRIMLDNANIIESYCGVVTPLTFTFAKEVYEKVYTQTLQIGKVGGRVTNALKPSLKEMLYYYESKVYYNLNSWYHLNSIFPSKKAHSSMERMMGVSTALTETKNVKMNPLTTILFLIRYINRLRRIKDDSIKFENKFNKVTQPFLGKAFSNLDNLALVELYTQLENEILNDFSTPIINDIGSMFYYGALTKMVGKMNVTNKEGYISFLLSKQGDVKSAESAPLFLKIAHLIKNEKTINDDFSNLDAKQLYLKYHHNSILSEAVSEYIKYFGARVSDELKLETITLIEDPTQLYEMLKTYIINDLDYHDNPNEQKFDVAIPFWKKRRFSRILNKTKFFIKNRESLRLKRTYIYSIVRNIFLAIGENLYNKQKLADKRDIFYLTKQEIFAYIKDNSPLPINIIPARKKQLEEDSTKLTYNRLALYDNEILNISKQTPQLNSSVLRGIPSGAGIAKGYIKYITTPKETLLTKSDIMLAYRTDPGWVVLFPLCNGIIVEKGSILSHSAVVAREMGIPAVVGVVDATKIIKPNTFVTVDGIKGEVVLNEEEK